MKRSELKKIIKPLVKECVQEALLKEGLLSGIVSEVAKGFGGQVLREREERPSPPLTEEIQSHKKQQILDSKKKLLDAIGKDAYGGIDIFEDTKPLRESASSMSPTNPLRSDGREPDDPGVDISTLPPGMWKKLAGKL